MNYGVSLVGRTFGLLTVIKFDVIKRKQTSWLCQCKCGNFVSVIRNSLVSNNTKSCGCLNKPDLTGKRFGKWTVVKDNGIRRNGDVVWECKCDCGKIKGVVSFSLTSGDSTSCNCGRKKIKTCALCDKIRSLDEHWHFTNPITNEKTSLCVNCYSRLWKRANPDKHREATYRWNNKNKDMVLKGKKRFRINNPASVSASRIKAQTNRQLRIVAWTDWDNINKFENNKPESMTTDHYIPLQGKNITGLHVSWNLNYMTFNENRRKNKNINLLEASKWYGKILEEAGLK